MWLWATWSRGWRPCPQHGVWIHIIFEVLYKTGHSMILWLLARVQTTIHQCPQVLFGMAVISNITSFGRRVYHISSTDTMRLGVFYAVDEYEWKQFYSNLLLNGWSKYVFLLRFFLWFPGRCPCKYFSGDHVVNLFRDLMQLKTLNKQIERGRLIFQPGQLCELGCSIGNC